MCVHILNCHRSYRHARTAREKEIHVQNRFYRVKIHLSSISTPPKQFSPPFTPPFFHGQIDFDYSSGSTNYGKVVHSDNPENWELSDLSSFYDQDYCLKISLFLNL